MSLDVKYSRCLFRSYIACIKQKEESWHKYCYRKYGIRGLNKGK